jgi:hypothetical protein
LILGGPRLVGLSRGRGTGHGEQQQDARDRGCHETSLAFFCVVEANESFGRSISEVLDDALMMKASE